jgi:YD repeat-containing protein
MRFTMLTLLAAISAAVLAVSAHAEEQTRIYDATGRSISTAVPYSDGSIRFYDAQGHSLGTSSTSGGTTTYYDARGNRIGTAVAPPRKR